MEICQSLLFDYPLKKLPDSQDVEDLLEACDNEKNTPLHTVAKMNNENPFRCLLEAEDNEKNTPLHIAAKMNNKNLFGCLLKEGRKLKNPKVNEKDSAYGVTTPVNRIGQTPLHLCAKHNRKEFIELLLTENEKLTVWTTKLNACKDDDQMTCLHLASSQGKCHTYSKQSKQKILQK